MVDISWITDRLAVSGALWTRENLRAVARAGVTHILNTQLEFPDRSLLVADDHDPVVLDLGTDDDLQPKPADYFRAAIRFALAALAQPRNKLLVHCASGVHRGPMVALAILRVLGFSRRDALRRLRAARPQANFPDVYLDSVEAFLAEWQTHPKP